MIWRSQAMARDERWTLRSSREETMWRTSSAMRDARFCRSRPHARRPPRQRDASISSEGAFESVFLVGDHADFQPVAPGHHLLAVGANEWSIVPDVTLDVLP